MKVLLDECIDWRLLRDLPGIDATTVKKMGWSETINGALLALADQHFDVFVTVDRNLSYQQNLGAFRIAIVVLRAYTNRLSDLRPLAPELLRVLPSLVPGELRIIGPLH
jgi:predicted nuclease of predicted toxin-antitoxin system